MGGACCKVDVVELNPDGKEKDPQTKEQMRNDPLDLRNAAKAADWSQMKMLLRRMPASSINSGAAKAEGDPEETGNTALHFAVSINHLKGVRKLVRYGHSVGPRNAAGKTPLHFALEEDKQKVATFLLERKASINAPDAEGRSPFLAVVASGRRSLATWIQGECSRLSRDLKLNVKDCKGNSSILYCAKYGWFDLLDQWLDKMQEPALVINSQNSEGETPLGWLLKFAASGLLGAAEATALAQKLIRAGAIAVVPSFEEKVPPLHLAAASNSPELYNVIAAAGADPLMQLDALGRTALHFAAARGATATSALLLDAGILPYQLDKQRNTPLHLAAMRGQESTVRLLLSKADNLELALLTPNKDGLSVYHLALKAGNSEAAQNAALDLIERLGDKSKTNIETKPGVVQETPLLLAIGAHQDLVVKKLLELGLDVNQTNNKGELPLSRNLAAVTAETYDSDAAIFDMLISAGSSVSSDSVDNHPLLAICKNNMSNFAERAVRVLEAQGTLDWDRRDAKGYTPLMLSCFHDNVWLVRHLLDKVHVLPDDPGQRTRQGAPQVLGSSGAGCCRKPVLGPGTVGGQTALMCAAKGASVGATKILLSRGARVDEVDSDGNTALAYALTLDKPETLECARVLLAAGAKTSLQRSGKAVEILDITGESWMHRAVRYGAADFIQLWASFGGCLELLASTPEDADDMPGAELKQEDKQSFLDSVPIRLESEEEASDDLLVEDEDVGEDSEQEAGDPGEKEGGPGAVAEGVEELGLSLVGLIKAGLVQSHYAGPSPKDLLRWRRRGTKWWEEFWVNAEEDLPPAELQDDLGWADQYSYCNVGEDELDEEDVLDLIRDQEAAAAAKALPRGGALSAIRTAQTNLGAAAGKPPRAEPPPAARASRSHSSTGSGGGVSLGDLVNRMISRSRHSSSGGSIHPASSVSSSRDPSPPGPGPVAEARLASSPALVGLPGLRSFRAALGRGHAEASGVVSSVCVGREAGPWDSSLLAAAAEDAEAQVNRLAYQAALGIGLTDDVMQAYGIQPPSAPPPPSRRCSGPVAEATEVEELLKSQKCKALSLVAGTPGEKLWATEPYYQPATRYQGLPRYMDESVHNWWPKVDCADFLAGGVEGAQDCYAPHVRAKMQEHAQQVRPSKWYLHSAEGPWNVDARLQGHKPRAEPALSGAALRERNMRWYLRSMGPAEFPLKAGQWKAFLKKSKKAVEAARARAPRRPGQKPSPRRKKAWFGIPALPSRPELNRSSPLVMAVRLGRVDCVAELVRLSTCVSLPDGLGLTPLQYALLLLVKDRHSPEVKRMVDLLLRARPIVSSRQLVQAHLLPRARRELEEFRARLARLEQDSGRPAPKGLTQQLQQLRVQVEQWEPERYQAADFPSVMDPLVLGVLMNDMPRVAWMVFKCGGNLNDAYVALPEIPVYFQGLWEKMVGRCHSRVLPLHVGILQKKFDTVRQLLDMGADPNAFGQEYSGQTKKDLKNRNKLFADKVSQLSENAADAAGSNPYERVWKTKTIGLLSMFSKIKRFVMSIEIPGISRPQPWVSALHLACRFGQAPIAFLLLKRGAAANGAGAAAFASKSPLEEALGYARTNAQAYHLLTDRPNYSEVRDMAFMDSSNPASLETHMAKAGACKAELLARCAAVAERQGAQSRGDGGGRLSAEEVYARAMKAQPYQPNTLALFGEADLADIAVPAMSDAAQQQQTMKMISSMMDYMDPIKGSIKAACLAAKIIVRIYLEMVKRPIVHWDPALYCAHVLLYHRAPLKVDDKQTAIVLRDMIDHAAYGWLGLDERVIADHVWKQTVVSKVNALKTNNDIGYKVMDMTGDCKVYAAARRKFDDAIESSFYNVAIESVLPAYYMPKLVEHLDGVGADGRPLPIGSLSHLSSKVADMLSETLAAEVRQFMAKVLSLAELEASDPAKAADPDELSRRFPTTQPTEAHRAWGRATLRGIEAEAKGGAEALVRERPKAAKDREGKLLPWVMARARAAARAKAQEGWPEGVEQVEGGEFGDVGLQLARGKLPVWYVQLAEEQLESIRAVIQLIATTFAEFDPSAQRPKPFHGMPQTNDDGCSMNPLDLMTTSSKDDFSYEAPRFPEQSMGTKARKTEDLATVDAVKAVQAAFVQVQAERLKAEQRARAAAVEGMLSSCAAESLQRTSQLLQERRALLADAQRRLAAGELLDFDDDALVTSAMNRINFGIAARRLGPAGPAVVAALQAGLGPTASLEVTGALVDVAKQLGAGGLAGGSAAALLAGLAARAPGGGLEFTAGFAARLDALAAGGGLDGLAGAGSAALGSAASARVGRAAGAVGLSREDANRMLQQLVQGGAVSEEDVQSLLQGGLEAVLSQGAEGLFAAVERRTGVSVPKEERERLLEALASGDLSLMGSAVLEVGGNGLSKGNAGSLLAELMDGPVRQELVRAVLEQEGGEQLVADLEEKGLSCLFAAVEKRTGVKVSPEDQKRLMEQVCAGEVDELLDVDVEHSEIVGGLAGKVGVSKEQAQGLLTGLLQEGQLRQDVMQSVLDGWVEGAEDKGLDSLLSAFQRRTGVKVPEEERERLRESLQLLLESAAEGAGGLLLPGVDAEAPLAAQEAVESLVDAAAAGAEDWAGAALSEACRRNRLAGSVMSLDAKLAADPVFAGAYKQAKAQAAQAARENLGPLLERLDDPSAPLDSVLGPGVSQDSLEGSVVDMNQHILAALEQADGEVLAQLVLGLELDMSADFEAVVQALADTRDALVHILELLDMDVV